MKNPKMPTNQLKTRMEVQIRVTSENRHHVDEHFPKKQNSFHLKDLNRIIKKTSKKTPPDPVLIRS